MQASFVIVCSVHERSRSHTRRSGCPVSISLERFGDRWSLLIIRDLMVRGYKTFKELHRSGEGIATNILADRLRTLEAEGIITAEIAMADGRRINYRLTDKGIDLAPVLLELLLWGAQHEKTGAPCALIAEMATHRTEVLTEVRRRWQDRDPIPFLPPFEAASPEPSLTASLIRPGQASPSTQSKKKTPRKQAPR